MAYDISITLKPEYDFTDFLYIAKPMGYYSEFSVVISGHPEYLEKVRAYLRHEGNFSDYLKQEVVDWIDLEHYMPDQGFIEYSSECWRCSSAFDDLVVELRLFTEEFEDKLAFAYVRLGEDFTDVDYEPGGDIEIQINRTFEIYPPKVQLYKWTNTNDATRTPRQTGEGEEEST